MAMITYPLNRIEYTAEDAELYNCTRGSGIFSKEDFAISVSEDGTSVTIGDGIGWIRNSKFSGKVIAQKEEKSLPLDVPDEIYTRIDAVAIQFDANLNKTEIVIKAGTPAESPEPPEMSRTEELYELFLYLISRNAGAATISESDIEDVRLDGEYCGLMVDAVTPYSQTPGVSSVHTKSTGDTYEMTLSLDDGSISKNIITFENGLPSNINVDGVDIPFTWEESEQVASDGVLFDNGSKVKWLNSGGAEVAAPVLSGSAYTATMYGDYFYTADKVDVTNFDTLKVNFTSASDNNTFAVSKTVSTLAADFAASKVITAAGEAELDISALTGQYYVLVLSGTPMTGSTSTFTADKVWLE